MSFDVDIVVLSNTRKEVAPGVELVAVDLRGKNPWSLPFPHKQIFASRLNNYDLFVYSEDDTLVTEQNLRAFLEISAVLPEGEIAGFLRFEQNQASERNFPDVHGHFHWDVGSVRVRGQYTLAHFTNEHAACYVLTRQQLRRAIDSGGFLVEPHQGKYDLLCTAATDPYTQCGLQKLICVSHLEGFLIHHLSNRYASTRFGVYEAELGRQLEALLQVGSNGNRPTSLFHTESKLWAAWYSKNYYEPASAELLAEIEDRKRVLSIGCGSGTIETALVAGGVHVSAIPLDPVIARGAEAKGVRMIYGTFQAARKKLTGERFDCLLLSNVVHLVPDPVNVLSSFAELLSEGGRAVLLAPNILRLSTNWGRICGDPRFQDIGSYHRSGIHLTSPKIVGDWLRGAGMEPETRIDILSPRVRKVSRVMLGLIDRLLASEFVITAKRMSG